MATARLIDYTGKGRPDERRHAANLLAFTKSTRLQMDKTLLEKVQGWDDDDMLVELSYMAKTIPSSWEFVDLIFLFSDVTRAGAQQITRTRNASYAMQSLRVVNAENIGVTNPFKKYSDAHDVFEEGVEQSKNFYSRLVELGAKLEDARGILPLNTNSNLVAKYNLRAFVELVIARKSLRVQGEYGDLVKEMEEQVIAVWPWSKEFFKSPHEKAIEILSGVVNNVGIIPGNGIGWEISKAIDLMRKDR